MRALALPTTLRAQRARLVLSDRWRKKARLEAVRRESPEPGVVLLRGGAIFTLAKLRVEAQEIRVRWLADHEDLLVYATQVELFQQERARPYFTKDVSAVTMANEEVHFFQQ